MNWNDIIAMRNNINDSFERLIISLYTYVPFRGREDYYLMYYSNKPLNKMLKTDTTKNYIISDLWVIFNKYKTDSTYGQQTFECPNEIYQQIINLTYFEKENNEQHYKNGDRLFLNKTNFNTFSKCVSRIFENYTGKHVTITAMRISFITDYYSSGFKTLNERIILAKQMAHSVDEQLQYMKILNFKLLSESELTSSLVPSSSLPSSIPSVPSSSIPPSVSFSIPSVPLSSTSLVPSSTSTSSVPVIPMPYDQFIKFMSKVCGDMYTNMYKNIYGQLYNNIKSKILALLTDQNDLIGLCPPENKSTKRIQSDDDDEDDK